MKKLGIFILAGVLATLMTACGQDQNKQPQVNDTTTQPTDTTPPAGNNTAP